MPGRQSAVQIDLDEHTRTTLHTWLHREMSPLGLAKRARAILELSQGQSFTTTAKQVGLTQRQVHKWARRFEKLGFSGLSDRPRSGRKPLFSPAVALSTVKLAGAQPHHSGRSLAQWDCQEIARQLITDGIVHNISAETVRRIASAAPPETVATPPVALGESSSRCCLRRNR
jgi:transposase